MEIFLLLWLPLCVAAAMFAHIRRNRSAFGWFVFAFFLSPFLAFVFLAILSSLPPPVPPGSWGPNMPYDPNSPEGQAWMRGLSERERRMQELTDLKESRT